MPKVRKSSGCPHCGSANAHPSEQWGFLDGILLLLGIVPYQCLVCARHFRRVREIEARWSREGFSLKLLPVPNMQPNAGELPASPKPTARVTEMPRPGSRVASRF